MVPIRVSNSRSRNLTFIDFRQHQPAIIKQTEAVALLAVAQDKASFLSQRTILPEIIPGNISGVGAFDPSLD